MEAQDYQCRLCMAYGSFQLNIFNEDLHHKHILMKLRTCLPVKVELGDGLPCSICYKCLSQLEDSFELWNKSFNSEAILRHNQVRGRVHPILENTTSEGSDSVFSNSESYSFDHDTYFIETREPQMGDLIQGESKNTDDSIAGKVVHMSYKAKLSEHLEKTHSNPTRYSSLSKEIPSSTNKLNSEHGNGKYNDNAVKKTHSTTSEQKQKKSDSVERAQKGQNCLGGMGTFWMENEEFPQKGVNAKNKYINKNLFGDSTMEMCSKLRKPQRNAMGRANTLSRDDDKCDTSRKRKSHFPSENIHERFGEEIVSSPETESRMNSKSERRVSKAKETDCIGGLQFDPNHCPKCRTTLTPSQNLLAHFQSHIQDD